MRKSFSSIGVAAVLAVAVLQVPSFAMGNGGEPPKDETVEIGFEGLEVDARQYASDLSIPTEVALERLEIQDDLGQALPSLKQLAGGRLAGAYIQHVPDFKAVLRLTGSKPLLVLDSAVKYSGLPITLEYGAGESQEDLITIVERTDWAAISPSIQGVYTDATTGEVVFDIAASGERLVEVSKLLLAHAALEGVSVRFDSFDEPFADSNRGGRSLSTCTSAFTVRNLSSNMLGMLTAGHCGNAQSYYWFSGGGPFPMGFVTERRWSNADVQWHTTSAQGIEALFHAESTSTARPQIGKGVGEAGQYLCKRGKTSGYDCGYVTSITYRPTYANACPGTSCQAVFSYAEVPQAVGDSGGSWFIGNRPHGIHKGGTGNRSIFTRVWYLNTMNVDVYQWTG